MCVGFYDGGYFLFSFDIIFEFKFGCNEIVVGVYDFSIGDGMLGKQLFKFGGIFYMLSFGIWQMVWLELVGVVYVVWLDMMFVFENQQFRFIVCVDVELEVEVVVLCDGWEIGCIIGVFGIELFLFVFKLCLWLLDDFFLYDFKVMLCCGGEVVDCVDSYFGMCSICVGNVVGVLCLLLNGKFVFQFGLLDQGFWLDGFYIVLIDEVLKLDLQVIKDLGFNMVCKYIKVELVCWFYWVDKFGLLVWQDMFQIWDVEIDVIVCICVEGQMCEIVD